MTLSKLAAESAKSIVNDSNIFEMIEYLRARYSDEKEYEDINDYGSKLAELLPTNVKYIRMSKRPFGPVVQLPDNPSKFLLYMKVKGNRGWLAMKVVSK